MLFVPSFILQFMFHVFIFYDFKSFAWVVATLFGITGYATFTTLSQGNLFLELKFNCTPKNIKRPVVFNSSLSSFHIYFRWLTWELLLWRHEFSACSVLCQHFANISARMLCVKRGNLIKIKIKISQKGFEWKFVNFLYLNGFSCRRS